MASAEHSLLRIFRHVGDFAAELAGRAHVDERQPRLAVLPCVLEKRADIRVAPHGRHRIIDRRVTGFFARERAALGHPLVAPAVHDFHIFVAEQPENPQRVAGPPVRFVAVENAGRVGTDPVLRADGGELGRGDVIAHGLILQVGSPVDMHRAGDVPRVVEENVLVAFDDADGRILQMRRNPVGGDECFGMCVVFLAHKSVGCFGKIPEGVGFEPTETHASPVFKTGALNRSATPPRSRQNPRRINAALFDSRKSALFRESPRDRKEAPRRQTF